MGIVDCCPLSINLVLNTLEIRYFYKGLYKRLHME